MNTKIAFDGDSILTVDEKKKLGLNTRMKYSKKFIEYFDPESFKTIEPKDTLECMHLDAFYRVSRKDDLLNYKKEGFKKVKIDAIRVDCTPEVRQIGLEQSARVFGFDKTVLQIPPAVCIQERNADVCGYKLLE